ncbi:MAG: sigma-70 family RNA polymerase sigma factor [Burkholderiales bacterium]|nr:sigma-70 family RNA polymerase sigma factor [Anaerolineae bacterium]
MSNPATSENQLITRIIERDEEALSELYTQYGAHVFGVALYILKNNALAEEATQDTFLKVWDSAQRWDNQQGNLKTWILTISRFTAIDILRREHRHFTDPREAFEESMLRIIQPNPTQSAEWDNATLLKSLIAQLPEEQIQAIELAFFMGMSHQEVATQLGEPLGTVKSRIRNGLQSLRGLWLMATSDRK